MLVASLVELRKKGEGSLVRDLVCLLSALYRVQGRGLVEVKVQLLVRRPAEADSMPHPAATECRGFEAVVHPFHYLAWGLLRSHSFFAHSYSPFPSRETGHRHSTIAEACADHDGLTTEQ